MSLARSASGPGGLTINTNAANSSAAATQPAASTGGLFGSTGASSATANPSTTGGMATTGGLFGSAQPKSGGLFGGASTSTTQPATGGLFGGASNTTTQPATGGLFGGASASQQTQAGAAPAAGGTGLFGGLNTQQPQQQQLAGGGLFGKPAAPAQGATGGSLFGGASTTQQPQQAQQTQGTGLFGQSAQTQQQQKPALGLFGASTTQPNAGQSTFGTNAAAPQQNQNANQIPGVQINYENVRPRSRFDDLAQPLQHGIHQIDLGIQRVMKMKDEIGEFMPQHERDIEQLGRDVKFVETKFRAVQSALNRDIQTVKVLQDMTKKNIGDAQLSFKATDNLKLPTHYHQKGLFASPPPTSGSGSADPSSTHASAQDLITYFNRVCDDVEKYKKRLDEYRGEIERDMPGVEKGLYEQIRSFRDRTTGSAAVQDQLGQVLLALRETGNAIVSQAGQIADTRERLSRLQAGIMESGAYAASMAA